MPASVFSIHKVADGISINLQENCYLMVLVFLTHVHDVHHLHLIEEQGLASRIRREFTG
jgi:hypothetical protein